MIRDVLCDLDGVLWRAEEPIDGSVEALSILASEGARLWFITNNSNRPVRDYEDRLEAMGLDANSRVLTSARAAASLVEPSMTAMACAGPGVWEELEQRGVRTVGADRPQLDVDAVVVGLHRDFDYARLNHASAAVRHGAKLIGTNSDNTFPTPQGAEPGGGSILAAVAAASSTTPILAGKPEEPMAKLVYSMIGRTGPLTDTIMIGDRPSTDGRFAERLGVDFWMVGEILSGEDHVSVPIARSGPDLRHIVDSRGVGGR